MLDDNIVNFSPFKPGQEITLIYSSFHKKLLENDGKFYPCVVFCYPGDSIEISEIKQEEENDKINWG